MNIHTGDYVMLKSVDEVKHLYKEWNPVSTPTGVLIYTGIAFFPSIMLNAMDAVNVYRVAWVYNDRVCVYINDGAYIFDEKCIKGVYKLVQAD